MRFDETCRSILRAVVVVPICAAVLAPAAVPQAVRAQSAGPGAGAAEGPGLVATGLLLRQMHGVKRVLMIAAHPDDEDTDLLATLARGMGAETAYLSLTRGDGGQNLIGPELWEGLAVIRTGELMAARELDGGRQFFTRAFDYGYSKSGEEAFTFWPREELLSDVVWVVRRFRPQVVVSVFSGTPADGHGQHQAAGILAREAFDAAGDPERFPEQLALGVEAWAPSKLYMPARRFDEDEVVDRAITLETGRMDPLLGRSFFQLAMRSRSQHRSQDMGSPQPPGPRTASYVLVESRVRNGAGGLFAGVDTTVAGRAADLPGAVADAVRPHLEAYLAAALRASDELGLDPSAIAPHLAEALDHLDRAEAALPAAPMTNGPSGVGADGLSASSAAPDSTSAGEQLRSVIRRKRRIGTDALLAASGITFDVRAEDDLIVPGQTTRVRAQLWNGGPLEVAAAEVELHTPGWEVRLAESEGLTPAGGVAPRALAEWTFEVTVPDGAEPSRLYYLRAERDGALYRWPDEPMLWGLPRDPAPVGGRATFRVSGPEVSPGPLVQVGAPWRYVGVDPARGEFERTVLVVPRISVRATPRALAWPQRRSAASTVSVVVRSEVDGPVSGEVSLEAPDAWSASPVSQPFELAGAGAERSVTFEVRPEGPEGKVPAGEHVFEVVARLDGGGVYRAGYTLVDYEHIERAALYEPAEAAVTVIPVAVTDGLRVGYIMGSGDDGPEAIRQMGATVELLDEDRVREGDFDSFDSVVLGVRAYETRPDLQAASGQLLDFVRRGGTVVAQYNRGPLGRLAPYPLEVGRGSPRVADETAPIRILAPDAPVFTTPNRITQADFEGWVQERGLYFGSEWDDRYVPLLEMNDPGEEPRHGSLLVTSVGEGAFVYAALSFFRQWAERVPGAYRLFANLISLDGDAWRAYAAGR